MLKVWKVTGDVEYGWCTIVVSANSADEAVRVVKRSKYLEYYFKHSIIELYPAEIISRVYDHTDIPRILAMEVGQE